MSDKLLTEHHLEFLSLKGGCTGSSENATLLVITCPQGVNSVTVRVILYDSNLSMMLYERVTGAFPSVKVPSISMENGGVLERAKMGISIYGEKE